MGINVPRLMRHAGVVFDLNESESPRVTTDQFYRLWEALEFFARDPSFALRLVGGSNPDEFDVAAQVAARAATFGDGLRKMARYKRMVCPEVVTVEDDGELVRVAFSWPLADRATPPLLVDACLAGALLFAQLGLDREIRPVRLELVRQEANIDSLRMHFGCDPVFGACANAILFASELLRRPFSTANTDFLSSRLLDFEDDVPSDEPTLVTRVSREIREQMQGDRPSVEAVARSMAMSGRSLQRKLVELGTTYQRILDETRHRMSIRLLSEPKLETPEIAFLLGFLEVNSFVRSFTAWEGMTPTRWRKLQGRRTPGAPATAEHLELVRSECWGA